jgi:hypothetical protein
MSKQSIDKIDQQISKMSNVDWQIFANKVSKDLELAKLRARLKKVEPSSKDILAELIE